MPEETGQVCRAGCAARLSPRSSPAMAHGRTALACRAWHALRAAEFGGLQPVLLSVLFVPFLRPARERRVADPDCHLIWVFTTTGGIHLTLLSLFLWKALPVPRV